MIRRSRTVSLNDDNENAVTQGWHGGNTSCHSGSSGSSSSSSKKKTNNNNKQKNGHDVVLKPKKTKNKHQQQLPEHVASITVVTAAAVTPTATINRSLDELFEHVDRHINASCCISQKNASSDYHTGSVHSSSLRTAVTAPLTPSISTVSSSIGSFKTPSSINSSTLSSTHSRSVSSFTPSSSSSSSGTAWKLRESMKNLNHSVSLSVSSSVSASDYTLPPLPESLQLASLSTRSSSTLLLQDEDEGSSTKKKKGRRPSSSSNHRRRQNLARSASASSKVQSENSRSDGSTTSSKTSSTISPQQHHQEGQQHQREQRRRARSVDDYDACALHRQRSISCLGIDVGNDDEDDNTHVPFVDEEDSSSNQENSPIVSNSQQQLRRLSSSSMLECIFPENDDDDDEQEVEEADEMLDDDDDDDVQQVKDLHNGTQRRGSNNKKINKMMMGWQIRELAKSSSSDLGIENDILATPKPTRRRTSKLGGSSRSTLDYGDDDSKDLADDILQTPSMRWRSQQKLQTDDLPSGFASLAMISPSELRRSSTSSIDGGAGGGGSERSRSRSRSNTPTHLIRQTLSNTIKKFSGGSSESNEDRAAKVDALKDRIRTRWTEMNEERSSHDHMAMMMNRSISSVRGQLIDGDSLSSIECGIDRKLQQHRQSKSLRSTRSIDGEVVSGLSRPKNVRRARSFDLNELDLGSCHTEAPRLPKESSKLRGKKTDFNHNSDSSTVEELQALLVDSKTANKSQKPTTVQPPPEPSPSTVEESTTTPQAPQLTATTTTTTTTTTPEARKHHKMPRPRSLKHPRRLQEWQINQEHSRHRVGPDIALNSLYHNRRSVDDSDEERQRKHQLRPHLQQQQNQLQRQQSLKWPTKNAQRPRPFVPPAFARSQSVSDLDSGTKRLSTTTTAATPKIDRQRVRDEIAEYRRAYMESKKKGECAGNGKAVGTVHQNTAAS
jgi:hypothetical protein